MAQKRTFTLDDIADRLERTFIDDERIPEDKRQYGKILIEEMRGQVGEIGDLLSSAQKFTMQTKES